MPDEALRPISADPGRDFAQFLAARGNFDDAAVERILRWRDERAEGLVRIITSLGLVPERELARLLSEYCEWPLVGGDAIPAELPCEDTLGTEFMRQCGVVPLAANGEFVDIAMADPLDAFARRAVEIKLGKPVRVHVAVASELEAALDRIDAQGRDDVSALSDETGISVEESDEDEQRLKDLASEAPVIRLVNLIVRRAVEARASDIHVEPFHNRLRVRYRVDGILRDVEAPPARLRAAIVSRIKIMANLNIAERRLPQDGRIKLVIQGKEIDVRVSIVPTLHGESAVLRILDGSAGVYDLDELGFSANGIAVLRELLDRPNGIVLVTGPTGSGKTTTLYAALLRLNHPDRKIITVEDPVEYQLEGVNQVPVRPKIGLRFADVLRSILRQDPDIIMIGEIRDLETAQIAVQASLTGHLVLSTLHTNSAAASISRLVDMGVEPYLLTSTLAGIVAQRLVRRLCPQCREPYDAPAELISELGVGGAGEGNVTLYRPCGCEACDGTGYRGRTTVAEILMATDELQSLVLKHASTRELAGAAARAGMVSMYADGMAKAFAGVTSIEEVLRVTAGDA